MTMRNIIKDFGITVRDTVLYFDGRLKSKYKF